ncbi:hypothetical protein DYH09_23990 [bacterium CPR1]|nr:hypothetical protein [bacterium CPR1]
MLFRPLETLLRALFGCAALLAWLQGSLILALLLTPPLAILALGPDPVGSSTRLDLVTLVARGIWTVAKWILSLLAHAPELLCLLAP